MALMDLLFGKKEGEQKADPIAGKARQGQLSALLTQEEALRKFRGMTPTEGAISQNVQSDIRSEERGIKGRAEDLKRRLQMLRAQQGLTNSAVGRGAALRIEDETQKRLQRLRRSAAGRAREGRLRTASGLINVGSQILGSQNAPIQFRDIKGQRQGGLAPALGLGLGAAFGGAGGASLGYSLGSNLQQLNR